MPSIEVEELVVRHGPLVAVDGVSFSAEPGQVLVLLGPNGAGKTSTVEAVEGYRRPDDGTVRVLGLEPSAGAVALRPRMGVMLQDGGVHPGLRPQESLALHAALFPDPVPVDELLARVGLDDRRTVTWRRLSGGEQRRLSFALAIVGRPEVVFLDEPTAGIDLEGRRLVREVVGELRDRGATVLLTTHDLDEAERCADHIVILDRGRVVADAPASELLASEARDNIAFAAPPGIDTDALGRALGGTAHEGAPGAYVVAVAPTPANVAALASWLAERQLPLGELRAGRRRLEEIFDRLTGEPREPGGAGGR